MMDLKSSPSHKLTLAKLFEQVLKNPIGSKENIEQLISRILKKRINQKKDKRTILQGALLNYARYGKNNPFSDVLSEEKLNQIKKKFNMSDDERLSSNQENVREKNIWIKK